MSVNVGLFPRFVFQIRVKETEGNAFIVLQEISRRRNMGKPRKLFLPFKVNVYLGDISPCFYCFTAESILSDIK